MHFERNTSVVTEYNVDLITWRMEARTASLNTFLALVGFAKSTTLLTFGEPTISLPFHHLNRSFPTTKTWWRYHHPEQ